MLIRDEEAAPQQAVGDHLARAAGRQLLPRGPASGELYRDDRVFRPFGKSNREGNEEESPTAKPVQNVVEP